MDALQRVILYEDVAEALAKLTDAELVTVIMRYEGYTEQEIADRRGVSQQMVNKYRKSAMKKCV